MYSIREKMKILPRILSIIFFFFFLKYVSLWKRGIYVFRRDNGHVLNIKMGGRKFKKAANTTNSVAIQLADLLKSIIVCQLCKPQSF